MATIAYTRVSTADQDTEGHRRSIDEQHKVDRWYTDEATSGSVKALDRPGFGALFAYVRDGDTVIVPAVDRLGRNTIDVLTTVEALEAKGVTTISKREGFDLSTPTGRAILRILATVAELERENIRERQRVGLERAKADGRKLGRPTAADHTELATWRRQNGASIRETANHFGVAVATVKRACQSH